MSQANTKKIPIRLYASMGMKINLEVFEKQTPDYKSFY